MYVKIPQWYSLDIYEKEEDRRMARILLAVITIFWIAALFVFSINLIWKDKVLAAILIIGGVLHLIPFWLLLNRKLFVSGFVLTGMYSLTPTIIATIGGGLHDYVVMLYPIAIMLGGLTAQQRGLIFSTLLTLAGLCWLVFGEQLGWLIITKSHIADQSDLLVSITLVMIVALIVHVLVSNAQFGLTYIWHELAEHRRTENALRESEANFRSLVENMNDVVIRYDLDLRYQYVSPSLKKFVNVSPEEIIGKRHHEVNFAQGMTDFFDDSIKRVIETKQPIDVEFDLPADDQKVYHLETRAYPEFDQSGNIKSVVTITRDITKRKKGEVALQESEKRYRLLAENIFDVIWILDLESSRFTYVSPSVEWLRGYTVEEVMEQDVSAALTPESLKMVQENISRIQKDLFDGTPTEKYYVNQVEQPCKDGSTVWTETTTRFVQNENTGRLEVYGVSRDITQRKKAEEALHQSEERFRIAQDISLDAFTILQSIRDNQGQIIDFEWTYVNEKAGEILKYLPTELIGKHLLDVLPNNRDNKGLFDRYIHITEGGQGNEIELEYVGEGIHGWFRNMAVKLGDGVAISFSDITNRKQAEESLRASEARYRVIVEDQTEFICRFLPDTTLVFVNQAYCEYFGKSEQDLIGRSYLDQIPPEHHEETRKNIESLKQPPYKTQTEKQMYSPNGESRWQQWVGRAILNSKGDVQEFQYVGRDITEIKKLQTKQQELVTIEERQRLARDLHDAISQTLFSARLTSEMLLQNREDLSTDELWSNIHQFTRLITSALGEMRVLLLELRPENLARTDATSILRNLADAMGSRTTADINLAVTEKGEMPTNVKIAFYRITQEALNNAIKHSRCKNISIKLTAKENESQLIIEDDGEGGAILKQNEGMSMGLNIMEERAREINAVLKIISPLKKGTKISCVWRKQ